MYVECHEDCVGFAVVVAREVVSSDILLAERDCEESQLFWVVGVRLPFALDGSGNFISRAFVYRYLYLSDRGRRGVVCGFKPREDVVSGVIRLSS